MRKLLILPDPSTLRLMGVKHHENHIAICVFAVLTLVGLFWSSQ